jgi:hypothetical protein
MHHAAGRSDARLGRLTLEPLSELQQPAAAADQRGMTNFVLSFFRRKYRRRIAVVHGPRHA